MFPIIHGVASQVLQGGGGDDFTPAWASLADSLTNMGGNGTVGWAFTVARPLVATKARVYSANTASTSRGVRIWRTSDSTNIGDTASFATAALGWIEEPFQSPISLVTGETYVIVTWRVSNTTTRIGSLDTSVTPWETIPEVTFVEGRESTSQNGVLATTVTNIVRGVDFWAEGA